MGTRLHELSRREFVDLKRQFVHPSTEVSQPDQLIGRDDELKLMRNSFEREGANPFIWGQRGVGKTSLAHTACTKYSDTVAIGPAIACESNSTVAGLFHDIIRRAVAKNRSLLKDTNLSLKLGALGFSLEGQLGGFRKDPEIASVNQASELLDTLFPSRFAGSKKTVVIIDEFDQLKNNDTITFLTGLTKQMSVDAVDVKLVFCGVASDFKSLVGSHESVGRYINAIKLSPLKDNDIWEIVDRVEANFGVSFHRGQKIRIGQIACGYPTFAHLIVDEALNAAFEDQFNGRVLSPQIFNEAMRRAASGAALHLQEAYEAATMKGTDRYVEVLWAVANGMHIQGRQFKDIKADYDAIMKRRPDRHAMVKDQDVRNHVNALCSESNGNVLERLKTGWYRFTDPMFRGYVRMMAYNQGIELGDESFPA